MVIRFAENDAPTVETCSGSKKSEVARLTMHVFPTEADPSRTTLTSMTVIKISKLQFFVNLFSQIFFQSF